MDRRVTRVPLIILQIDAANIAIFCSVICMRNKQNGVQILETELNASGTRNSAKHRRVALTSAFIATKSWPKRKLDELAGGTHSSLQLLHLNVREITKQRWNVDNYMLTLYWNFLSVWKHPLPLW